jgi:hypothetical protein
MFTAYLMKAYRRPREVTWLTGVALFGVALARFFALHVVMLPFAVRARAEIHSASRQRLEAIFAEGVETATAVGGAALLDSGDDIRQN